MEELKLSEMLKCQMELWEKHKAVWPPMEPVDARNCFLWMMEELGEVMPIIKKKGEEAIMSDATIKAHFTEELVDVLMYYLDVLNRYGITGEELSEVYIRKHNKNMGRDFASEHSRFLGGGE